MNNIVITCTNYADYIRQNQTLERVFNHFYHTYIFKYKLVCTENNPIIHTIKS